MDFKFSPKNWFSLYRDLIIESKKWLLFAILLLFAGALTGFLVTLYFPSFGEEALIGYASSIDQDIKPGLELTQYVFLRNFSIAALASILGAFFGLIPILVTYINGMVLGIVFGYLPIQGSASPWHILLLTAPHGIFEYAGTILAMGFGLKLGINWMFDKKGKSRKGIFLNDLKNLLKIYPLVFLLLAVAAIVEGLLTIPIACFFAGICL